MCAGKLIICRHVFMCAGKLIICRRVFMCAGKLIICRVTGIAHRRPNKDLLEVANPVRNDETGLWQCPFCEKKDFPELSEVIYLSIFQNLALIFDAASNRNISMQGDCQSQRNVREVRGENFVSGNRLLLVSCLWSLYRLS